MAGFVAAPALRVAVAVLYVVGPNSSEIYVNANNSQWHLTLAAVLILLSVRRSGMVRSVVDTPRGVHRVEVWAHDGTRLYKADPAFLQLFASNEVR